MMTADDRVVYWEQEKASLEKAARGFRKVARIGWWLALFVGLLAFSLLGVGVFRPSLYHLGCGAWIALSAAGIAFVARHMGRVAARLKDAAADTMWHLGAAKLARGDFRDKPAAEARMQS